MSTKKRKNPSTAGDGPEEKVQLIQSILDEFDSLPPFWMLDGDEVGEIAAICQRMIQYEGDSDNEEDNSALSEYSSRLDQIYNIVPNLIHTTRAQWNHQ